MDRIEEIERRVAALEGPSPNADPNAPLRIVTMSSMAVQFRFVGNMTLEVWEKMCCDIFDRTPLLDPGVVLMSQSVLRDLNRSFKDGLAVSALRNPVTATMVKIGTIPDSTNHDSLVTFLR